MRRRDFFTLLGGAVAAPSLTWPRTARAQQSGKAVIGILESATPAGQSQWLNAFTQRMRELGWTEGRNLAIELRWGEGRSERYAEVAAEFARLKVDVIVASGSAVPA